jgi:hypothetical protein
MGLAMQVVPMTNDCFLCTGHQGRQRRHRSDPLGSEAIWMAPVCHCSRHLQGLLQPVPRTVEIHRRAPWMGDPSSLMSSRCSCRR